MSDYFSRERNWTEHFDIPKKSKILDIGCGKGVLGRFLKKKYQCIVTGVEINEKIIDIARENLDNVYLSDIESFFIKEKNLKKSFDIIVFSDSLEHMIDPMRILDLSKEYISNNGSYLISFPNIRNFRVTIPLILFDKFEYTDEGLLDKTHLYFSTTSSFIKRVSKRGFKIKLVKYELPLNSISGMINILTLGLFKRFLSSHFYIELKI